MHKGYFLITVTPDTLNQTIEYAAQSGMKYYPWMNNGGGGNMGPLNYAYQEDYQKLLPFATQVRPRLARCLPSGSGFPSIASADTVASVVGRACS